MKTIKMHLLFGILVTLLSCNSFAQDSKTPTLTKTFDMNRAGTLYSHSSGGRIVVTTHDKSEVVVDIFIRKNGVVLSPSDSEIEDVLEAFDLVVEKNGTAITATAKRKSKVKMWNNTGIYFTIIVPREMSCDVSSSGGGLRISGVEGTHDFSSSGGSVKLNNTSGRTKASSSGGSVSAIQHNGDVDLRSSGGGVTAEDVKGYVKAHSSGGSVKLQNVIGGVNASSSGGSVSVTGVCPTVKASSSGGSVRVDISNLSKEVYLSSSGGGVNAIIHKGNELGLDLDLISTKVNIELSNFTGKAEKNRVKGAMNGGGIPVYMRSSGGNVTVKYN